MNEAPNPQPARRADAHRLADQLSGDPLAPGATRFLCQQVNGDPKLFFQLYRCPVRSAKVSQAGLVGGVGGLGHGGGERGGVLTRKGGGKNRGFHWRNCAFSI